jgi:phosphoribosyl-AMP cyclohydrolase
VETMTIENLKFDSNGLIPAIVQDTNTNDVLMFAFMNAESLALTLSTGETHFWSRSRQELWHKGATSGNIQSVVDVRVDCDADSLLIRVNPAGPACHNDLLVRREERPAKDSFHVRSGGLPVACIRGPVVHHVGEQ